ncbi:MAG TPA: glycosyltransferase family 39 protein [Gaiellaceae bacterium]|nr:glycosyltransferase family 39 protein [Gaiellaceae bacterium]
MSASESTWPDWLRSRTAVELLGPPRLFFAWLTIALSLLVIVYVGAWNAAKYPIVLGYDAQPNAAYAHVLLDQHHIPRPDQSGESNQPPAYYFLAGVAARVGLHWPFNWREARPFTAQLPEASYRGAQIFNVVLVFLTALCVLWLARTVAPDRPWVWAASVGFFAFLPVVSKTEAMFHPENLNMLCSAAAMASITQMLAQRRFRWWLVTILGVSLALGLATRASAIFTLLAVLLGTAIAATVPGIRSQVPWRRLGAVVLAAAILVTPWIAYRAVVRHQGPLNETSRLFNAALHPRSHQLSDVLTSHKKFFHVAVVDIFRNPWRSHFKNQAFSQTYVEIWGDWLGNMAWSSYDPEPSTGARKILKDQSLVGVLPTTLAIAGWLMLVGMSFRRRELAPLALLPLIAVGGYFYRSYVSLTHDGDLLKAAYALNSAPVWSLGFGIATAWLAARSLLLRYGMIALFVAFAILELRFVMYGIRDGVAIF